MTPEKNIEQLRRMKDALGNGHPQDALDFVNGPGYGGHGLSDLYKTQGCMWLSAILKQEFKKCLNCSRLDRLNMMCKVGRVTR